MKKEPQDKRLARYLLLNWYVTRVISQRLFILNTWARIAEIEAKCEIKLDRRTVKKGSRNELQYWATPAFRKAVVNTYFKGEKKAG